MAQVLLGTGVAQATPSAGQITVYAKSADKGLYYKDETGLETGPLAPAVGGGTVTHTAGALTASAVVVGNGTADVKVLASLGTTTTVLHGNAAGLPSFGAVVLTADVSGILPSTAGGTGVNNAKNLTVSATLTLAGTDSTTMTFPGTSGSVLTADSTNTVTNKRITLRVGSTASSATPTINTDVTDIYKLTAQAVDITSFTTNLSGTPVDGDAIIIEITGTAARAITWGTSFEASTVALPTTTVTTAMLAVAFLWNTATSKWRCVAAV